MAKTIMSVLAFIAFGFSSHAQTGIASLEIYKKENESRRIKVLLTGKITDAVTGEALPGASIYIADIKLGTIADTGGKYFFRDIPFGHHLVEVSHIGYTSIIEHIDIDKNTEKDFALQPSVLENQGVIVTGVSNATNIRKSPVPVTAIRRAELLQSSSTNIIDLLSKKPGVFTTGHRAGYFKTCHSWIRI